MRPKILHTRILKPNPKSSPTVHTKTSHSIKSVLKCASGVRGDKKDKILVSDDKKDKIDNNINSMIEKIDVPEIEQKLSISNTKWIAPKIVTSRIVELSRTREGQVGGNLDGVVAEKTENYVPTDIQPSSCGPKTELQCHALRPSPSELVNPLKKLKFIRKSANFQVLRLNLTKGGYVATF